MQASKVKSIINMSSANIYLKRDLRRAMLRVGAVLAGIDALGDDPVLNEGQASSGKVLIQHVDLGDHYQNVNAAAALMGQAYAILADTHNDMTRQAMDAGFVMDIAPNGGGGR